MTPAPSTAPLDFQVPAGATLVVISGPSGAGKTTIVDRLEEDPRVSVVVTATTRPKRRGEQEGVDYHFLDRAEFERRIQAGDFLEWEEVFRNGHLYGTLKSALKDALRRSGGICVLEIDVEGGLHLKRGGVPAKYVFIAPPSLEELRARIVKRGTESADAIDQRMRKAGAEMDQMKAYDHVVENRDLEQAYRDVRRWIGLEAGSNAETER